MDALLARRSGGWIERVARGAVAAASHERASGAAPSGANGRDAGPSGSPPPGGRGPGALPSGARGRDVASPAAAPSAVGTGRAASPRSRRPQARPASWARDWAGARRILVLRLDNIGDVVMTGPALRAIRRSRPHARVHLMASRSGVQAAPLLALDRRGPRPSGRCGRSWAPPPATPSARAALVERIRAGRWDGAVILTSFSQSPHPAALACRRAGIPLVAGASDEAARALTHRLPKGDPAMHQACRNLALVRALGFGAGGSAMEVEVPAGARAAARALLGDGGRHLLLSPWASAPARQYDPRRMAAAAAQIAAAHGLRVVVTGAPGDRDRGAALARSLGPSALDLTGRTSVAEAAALIESATLVLCCNSSAMHLAEALGVPAAILFAGTELPSQWAPRQTPHRLLRRHVPCAPCHEIACPFGHGRCPRRRARADRRGGGGAPRGGPRSGRTRRERGRPRGARPGAGGDRRPRPALGRRPARGGGARPARPGRRPGGRLGLLRRRRRAPLRRLHPQARPALRRRARAGDRPGPPGARRPGASTPRSRRRAWAPRPTCWPARDGDWPRAPPRPGPCGG